MYVSSQFLLGSEKRNGTQKGTKVHVCTVAAEVCKNHVYIHSAKVTLNSEEIMQTCSDTYTRVMLGIS